MYDLPEIGQSQQEINGHTRRPHQTDKLHQQPRREQSLWKGDELSRPTIRISLCHRGRSGVRSIGWRTEKINTLEILSSVTWSIRLNSRTHNDYPLATERVAVTPSVLSEKQVELARQNSRGLIQKDLKLLPSLLNKVRYVTHYRNLKFYIEDGFKLRKIHRVKHFNQSRWLQSSIAKNTNLRTAAKSYKEKEFFKLRNNSISGKTLKIMPSIPTFHS